MDGREPPVSDSDECDGASDHRVAAAFRRLFDLRFEELYRFAYRYVRSSETAKDLVRPGHAAPARDPRSSQVTDYNDPAGHARLEAGRRELRKLLDLHPEGVKCLPGYIWLDMPGKVRSVPERELEFRPEPP